MENGTSGGTRNILCHASLASFKTLILCPKKRNRTCLFCQWWGKAKDNCFASEVLEINTTFFSLLWECKTCSTSLPLKLCLPDSFKGVCVYEMTCPLCLHFFLLSLTIPLVTKGMVLIDPNLHTSLLDSFLSFFFFCQNSTQKLPALRKLPWHTAIPPEPWPARKLMGTPVVCSFLFILRHITIIP